MVIAGNPKTVLTPREDGKSGTGVFTFFRQFDSCAPAQNQINFDVIATRNCTEYESRNRNGNMLNLLHNRKSSHCICELFLVNTLSGTVPILMPVGTGSWRHNRAPAACWRWALHSPSLVCCGGANRIDDFVPYLLESDSYPHFLPYSL